MGGATGNDFCITRHNTDGTLDTTFDTDGILTTTAAPLSGNEAAESIAVQADGRIVTSGWCDMGGATGDDFCITRHNTDGTLDTTFDGDGIVTAAIAPGAASEAARAVAVQADGRIVVAGYCDMGGATGSDFCLAQYSPGGIIDQYDDAGSDDWDSVGTSIGHFGACLAATTLSTPTWTVNASCPTDDGAFWNAVPAAAPSAIAVANPLTSTATATIRFGTRIADTYPTGDYIAPITFSVVAA
jgi:uncharacterized delta-60 repeat protein